MTKYDEVPTRALGTRLGLIEDLSHTHSVPPVYANKRIGNDWHISVPVQGNGYHFFFFKPSHGHREVNYFCKYVQIIKSVFIVRIIFSV